MITQKLVDLLKRDYYVTHDATYLHATRISVDSGVSIQIEALAGRAHRIVVLASGGLFVSETISNGSADDIVKCVRRLVGPPRGRI